VGVYVSPKYPTPGLRNGERKKKDGSRVLVFNHNLFLKN